MNNKNKYFPLLIDLSKYKILLIGGGSVAARKVKSLLLFNGNITVLAINVCEKINKLGEENLIKIIIKNFEKDDINDYDIIFSTIDDIDTSRIISESASEKKKLLNSADIPELCDFILPANIIRGPLTFSIASQGTAPFYVKFLKDKFSEQIPAKFEKIANLAAGFRQKVLELSNISEQDKKAYYDKFLKVKWEDIPDETFDLESERIINSIIKGTDG
ncbi:MAG: uroporphyrinogen-III C-methyltransferase / precorrin-2 dehydrogenase [Ignavibacteria bacterium]|nr:uroporphyrinogen-III C-methyltransferase / precorrin-2 dehydrogenase [Ignavibacteria bacterium]